MDTDIRLYPMDSTNMTLSICWSREIATLPRPNTLLLPLSVNLIVFFDEGLRENSMRRFISLVISLVHPLSIINLVLPEDFSCRRISISHKKLWASISLKNFNIPQDFYSSGFQCNNILQLTHKFLPGHKICNTV